MEVPQGHEAALRTAAQNKPPTNNARPWPRGGGAASSSAAPPPPPPKVYRVEPREFRDLVQRLTGAPPAALQRRPQHHQHPQQHQHRVGVAAPPVVVQPQPLRPGGGGAGEQPPAYGAMAAPWFSFPMAGAVDTSAQPQHGAFLSASACATATDDAYSTSTHGASIVSQKEKG